jgi:hypothetical protein
MTLPEWVESVIGLIGKLSAMPIKMSKRAVTAAAYVGTRFTAALTGLFNEGLAKPLRELADSKLQKIKSTDIADAAEAHNSALWKRREAEEKEANAELLRSKARVNDAQARAIDGETELKLVREQQRLAEERRKEAEARLRSAARKLKADGGTLYLDKPHDSDDEDEEKGAGAP